MGRPGCGKGTQVKFLKKKTGFEVIKTGELLRKKAQENDFISKKITETLSKGKLIPTPLVFLLWMPKLMSFREKGVRGIIFDGSPRKLYEAYMLEELFEMFEWDDVCAIHIKIDEDEARERLLKRGRSDDNEDDIEERLEWFKDEVGLVIDYYSSKNILLEINGEQTIRKVEEDISQGLGNIGNKF